MSLIRKFTLALTLSAALASTVSAHGLWIAQRHGDLALVYGHGATDEAYDPNKIVELKAYDADFKPVEFKRETFDDHAFIVADDDHAVITAVMDNGFWTEKTDGSWEQKSKAEVKDGKNTGHYFKYATSIVGHAHGTPKPFGMPLEIVPLADPTAMKAGDALTVQVFANGKPAADAKVTAEYTTASDAPILKTDADGKVTVNIRNQGLNVIVASTTEKTPDSAEQDEIGRLATLSFTLGHGPE